MHHPNLTITNRHEITGRGTVFTVNITGMPPKPTIWIDEPPISKGDTFSVNETLYEVVNIELKRNNFDGKIHKEIGLMVKVI